MANVLLAGLATNGCTSAAKDSSGNGTIEDLERLRNLAGVIKDTALCGLGQTSPNPVLSTMDNFYDEYLAHVKEKRLSVSSMSRTDAIFYQSREMQGMYALCPDVSGECDHGRQESSACD